MIETVLRFDRSIFFLINNLPHAVFFDSFFAFLSGVGAYRLVWVVIVIALILLKEIHNRKTFFALCLTIFVTLVVVDTMKVVIARPRPEFTQSDVVIVGDMSGSYAFPSAHAAVAFASAVVLTKKQRKFSRLYYVLALFIAFARIYLGKHYPSDVVAGAILGWMIGYFGRAIASN